MTNRTMMTLCTAALLLVAVAPMSTAHRTIDGTDTNFSEQLTGDNCRRASPASPCPDNEDVSGNYYTPGTFAFVIAEGLFPLHTQAVNLLPLGFAEVFNPGAVCDMEVQGFGDGPFDSNTPENNPTDALDEKEVDGSPGGLQEDGIFDDGGIGCASHTHHYAYAGFNDGNDCGDTAFANDANAGASVFIETSCDSASSASVGGSLLGCIINDVVFAGSTEPLMDGANGGGQPGVDPGETDNIADTIYVGSNDGNNDVDLDDVVYTVSNLDPVVLDSTCGQYALCGVPVIGSDSPACVSGEVVTCTPGGGGDRAPQFGAGSGTTGDPSDVTKDGVAIPGVAVACPNSPGYAGVTVHNAIETTGALTPLVVLPGVTTSHLVATAGWIDGGVSNAAPSTRTFPADPAQGTVPPVCAAEDNGVGSGFTLEYPCAINGVPLNCLPTGAGVVVLASMPADEVLTDGGSATGTLTCGGGGSVSVTAFVGQANLPGPPVPVNVAGPAFTTGGAASCTVSIAGAATIGYAQCFAVAPV